MLIAAEGIDGAGKTTLLDRLADDLEARGRRVVRVRRYILQEITDIWWRLVEADVIDQRGTALLAAADYELGVRKLIRPALDDGAVVLADKYVYSHYVYFHRRGTRARRAARDVRRGPGARRGAVPHAADRRIARAPARHGRQARPAGGGPRPPAGPVASEQAFRRYGLGGAPVDLRQSHFVDEHARNARLFDQVLPPAVTHALDGTRAREQIHEAALELVAARMDRVVG